MSASDRCLLTHPSTSELSSQATGSRSLPLPQPNIRWGSQEQRMSAIDALVRTLNSRRPSFFLPVAQRLCPLIGDPQGR